MSFSIRKSVTFLDIFLNYIIHFLETVEKRAEKPAYYAADDLYDISLDESEIDYQKLPIPSNQQPSLCMTDSGKDICSDILFFQSDAASMNIDNKEESIEEDPISAFESEIMDCNEAPRHWKNHLAHEKNSDNTCKWYELSQRRVSRTDLHDFTSVTRFIDEDDACTESFIEPVSVEDHGEEDFDENTEGIIA